MFYWGVLDLKVCPPFTELKSSEPYHRLNAEKIVTSSKIRVTDQAQGLFAANFAKAWLHGPDVFCDLTKSFRYRDGSNLL